MGRRAGRRWSGCSPVNRAVPARHLCGDRRMTSHWSRKRVSYQPPDDNRTVRSSVAYAELHAHSAFSFLDGASTPEELVEEAVRLDLRAIALTDHNGLYGAVRFAEAAAELDMRTVFGAELSLGVRRPDRRPRSGGPASAGVGSRPGRLPAVVAAAGRGASGRRRERQAAFRLRCAHRRGGRALAHPDRLPQRSCPLCAGHRRAGCGLGGVGRSGGPVRASERVSVELTHHGCIRSTTKPTPN